MDDDGGATRQYCPMYHEVGTGGSGSMRCPGDGSITFCGCGETIKTCGSLSFAEDPEAFWPVDAFAAVAQRTQGCYGGDGREEICSCSCPDSAGCTYVVGIGLHCESNNPDPCLFQCGSLNTYSGSGSDP